MAQLTQKIDMWCQINESTPLDRPILLGQFVAGEDGPRYVTVGEWTISAGTFTGVGWYTESHPIINNQRQTRRCVSWDSNGWLPEDQQYQPTHWMEIPKLEVS